MNRKLLSKILLILFIVSTSAFGVQSKEQVDGGVDNSSTNYQSKAIFESGSKYSKQYSNYSSSSCPPWFYYNATSSACTCGPNHYHVVHCNETLLTSSVLDCYCVNFDEAKNVTVAGACSYNCINKAEKDSPMLDTVYRTLPKQVSELNSFMCGRFNRTGPLCGKCVNGSYPLAYSYNLSCVYCPNSHKNWWKFILAAFVPLTFFYFIVLFFKISATSSHLHGYVFFSQGISTAEFARIAFLLTTRDPKSVTVFKVAVSLYSIWNLDFFRALLPNICLQITTLQMLALDYAIAVYPLFLMIISYVLIELHDRNVRVIVFIWKPFRYLFIFFRRNWDSRTSVIDAYATFFLLSFTKFLRVSIDILTPSHLYTFETNNTMLVLYYDGTIEYFGKEHLPYAILAIAILVFFILVPTTILFLYPFKFFQKFLSCFPRRWCNILHTFVDSFLGCYKDGTEPGTQDCRWFAILFLVCRIIGLFIHSIATDSAFFSGATLLLLTLTMILVTTQPFKPAVAHFTSVNATFVLLLAMFYVGVSGMNVSSTKAMKSYKPYYIITCVIGIIPPVYMSCIVIHWIFTQRKWGKNLLLKFRAWRKGYDWMAFENGTDSDQNLEESLPDRIVNPHQYHEGNLTDFHSVSCDSKNSSNCASY